MYGIAIGASGEAYEMGANSAKRVPTTTELNAKKRQQERLKQVKAANLKKKLERQQKLRAAAAKRKAAPKKAQKMRQNNNKQMQYRQASNATAKEMPYRKLPGLIGDGLSGFGEAGESVINEFGADFGSLNKDSGKGNYGTSVTIQLQNRVLRKIRQHRYQHDAFAGYSESNHLGDASALDMAKLVFNIKEAVTEKQKHDAVSKANWAKLRKLPASPAKTALIDMQMKADTNYNETTLIHIWKAIDLIETVKPEFAKQLRGAVDGGVPVEVALGSPDFGMGLLPLLVPVALGVVALSASAYLGSFITASRASTAQMLKNAELIDKLILITNDPNATPQAKAEASKSIASLAASTSALSADTGILANIASITKNLPMLIGLLGGGYLFWKFGLPMLNKKNAIKPVYEEHINEPKV